MNSESSGDALVHPAAEALVAFDEHPAGLAPGTQEWIRKHLESCSPCREALAAEPPLVAEAPRALGARGLRRRLLPAAAAAGWLLAGFLGLRAMSDDARGPALPGPGDLPRVVLVAQRDGEPVALPGGAERVALSFVLGEAIEPGEELTLAIETADGLLSRERPVRVAALDEWGWPILHLDRTALPPGRLILHVRTPSGHRSAFHVLHP